MAKLKQTNDGASLNSVLVRRPTEMLPAVPPADLYCVLHWIFVSLWKGPVPFFL